MLHTDYIENSQRAVGLDWQHELQADRDEATSIMITTSSDIRTITAEHSAREDDIARYPAGDVYHIRSFKTNPEPEQAVHNMKKAALIEHQKLKECESGISASSSLSLFGIILVIRISLAVLLNIVNIVPKLAPRAVTFSLVSVLCRHILVHQDLHEAQHPACKVNPVGNQRVRRLGRTRLGV